MLNIVGKGSLAINKAQTVTNKITMCTLVLNKQLEIYCYHLNVRALIGSCLNTWSTTCSTAMGSYWSLWENKVWKLMPSPVSNPSFHFLIGQDPQSFCCIALLPRTVPCLPWRKGWNCEQNKSFLPQGLVKHPVAAISKWNLLNSSNTIYHSILF